MITGKRQAATLANALGYQAVWFACVAGAASGSAWPGLLASLLFMAATLAFGGRARDDLRSLLVLLPLGLGLDSLFTAVGWIRYSPPGPWPLSAPGWIAAIWLGFGMTLNHSLAFLRGRHWLAGTLGLLGAPLAYWSASRGFGVVQFGQPTLAVLFALGLCWSLLLPLVYSLDGELRHRLQVQP